MIRLLAFDIGGSSVKSATVEILKGGPRLCDFESAVLRSGNFSEVKGLVFDRLQRDVELQAIGIATTGTVDSGGRVIRAGAIDAYEDVDWRELVVPVSKLPTTVINDGLAAAWGEYCVRRERKTRNSAHLVVGSGVGGGLILDGRPYRGEGGIAGALGHVKTARSRGKCTCGDTGCVELVAGGRAIIEESRIFAINHGAAKLPESISDVVTMCQAVGPPAIGLLTEAGAALGFTIASVINVLNPGLVTIGGGVIAAFDGLDKNTNPYLAAAVEHGSTHALTKAASDVVIRRATLGNRAGLMGAALYALGVL